MMHGQKNIKLFYFLYKRDLMVYGRKVSFL